MCWLIQRECNSVINVYTVFKLTVNFELRALVRIGTEIDYTLCIEEKKSQSINHPQKYSYVVKRYDLV